MPRQGNTDMLMRSRILREGFFCNELLAECQPLVRLLFQGLWCLADREGRLEDRPARIKIAVLPFDKCDIEKMLMQLHDKQFITRYSAGLDRFIWINKFLDHQKVHPHEKKSVIPPFVVSTNGDVITSNDNVIACNEMSLNVSIPLPLTLPLPFPLTLPLSLPHENAEPANVGAEEFVLTWNSVSKLPRIAKMTDDRIKHLKARLQDGGWAASWREALQKLANSSWCCGGGKDGWRADVDWFLKPGTLTKIMEGKYDNRDAPAKPSGETPEQAAERERRQAEEAAKWRADRAAPRNKEDDNV